MFRRASVIISASVGIHLVLGVVVCLFALSFLESRQETAQQAHELMAEEEAKRDILQRRVLTAEARLDGLRSDNPYVIELIARARLGYTSQPDESVPPRQP